jgi:hypothetical protein
MCGDQCEIIQLNSPSDFSGFEEQAASRRGYAGEMLAAAVVSSGRSGELA